MRHPPTYNNHRAHCTCAGCVEYNRLSDEAERAKARAQFQRDQERAVTTMSSQIASRLKRLDSAKDGDA